VGVKERIKSLKEKMMADKRPGRAAAAERRRVARNHLRKYSTTDAWKDLPAVIRVAIEEMVPEIRKDKR